MKNLETISKILKDICVTCRPAEKFDHGSALVYLKKIYNEEGLDVQEMSENFSWLELRAGGALLDYINETQKGRMPFLEKPGKFLSETKMAIDPSTRRSLELIKTNLDGRKKGSLLFVIDKTTSAMGGRLLYSMLSTSTIYIDLHLAETNRTFICLEILKIRR